VPSLFFYISGHGFGHSIRQIEIINALIALAPVDLRIVVRTSAPGWLFTRAVRGAFTLLAGETDTGVVQIDSLRLDEDATIERAARFYQDFTKRVDEEIRLLTAYDARVVVADAPPLASRAASAAGIPSAVCANFTWDWIYREYTDGRPEAPNVIATIQDAYSRANAAWRMPMHGGFETFDRITDIPFVARHARQDRTVADIRAALDMPRDRPLALVSFGGYGVRDLPLDRLDCTPTWPVVIISPGAHHRALPEGVHGVPEERIYERGLRFEDVVRAVDVVITKPGYGIISDCVANGAALLYTSRGRFAEYDVMVREMPRVLRCRFIEMDAFLNGRWKDALDALAASPEPPERARTDGAGVVAEMILSTLPR
jgi:hypothetical protein